MTNTTCDSCRLEFDEDELENCTPEGESEQFWCCSNCADANREWIKTEEQASIDQEAMELGDGEFFVVRTAFHGGGIIGNPNEPLDARRAIERKRWYQEGDCTCGCAGIIRADELGDLETQERNRSLTKNPYALTR